jgi:ribonuclease HI
MTNKDVDIEVFLQSLSVEDVIEAYTDGSCLGNPGPGGWGVIFLCNGMRATISGSETDTTNNRMELLAAINGIETLPTGSVVTVRTDSMYLKNGITIWIKSWKKNGWKSSSKSSVKNKDLWERLDEAVQQKNVSWCWVKGHDSCQNNNSADFLARSAIVSAYMKDEQV